MPEDPLVVISILPSEDDPPSAEEALETVELDALGTFDVTLAASVDELPPIGRSWAWDFDLNEFAQSRAGHSPRQTNGDETLRFWVQKALLIDRGAYPIHSDDYGLDRALSVLDDELEIHDLEERVRDCLTFHPHIEDVVDFAASYAANPDGGTAAIEVYMTLVMASGLRVPVEVGIG